MGAVQESTPWQLDKELASKFQFLLSISGKLPEWISS